MKLNTDKKVREAAQVALYNTEREESIRQRMEAYGFRAEDLKRGKALMARVKACTDEQDHGQQRQWELSQQIKEQTKAVQDQARDHIQVVRTLYRHEPAVLHFLRVETMSRSGWPMVEQAAYLYEKLQERKLSLAAYGISDQAIRRAATETSALLTLRQDRSYQKAQAEHCTQTKRQAIKELYGWVVEFRAIARLAFKSEPQWLEAFGMVVRSAVWTGLGTVGNYTM